jgi:hypothetical protein
VRIISLQNERQEKHNYSRNTERPKGVDVRQSGRLRLQRPVDSSKCLPLSRVQAQSSMGQLLNKAIHRISKPRVPHIRTRDQPRLVELGSAYNHRCHNRCSNTASDISREVHEASDSVALILSDPDVRGGGSGYKNETHRQILADAQ